MTAARYGFYGEAHAAFEPINVAVDFIRFFNRSMAWFQQPRPKHRSKSSDSYALQIERSARSCSHGNLSARTMPALLILRLQVDPDIALLGAS